MNKVLIIEGASDEDNGSLRKGFNLLLAQKVKGKMPQIFMGDSTATSVKSFLKDDYPGSKKHLLIDLDNHESFEQSAIEKYKLQKHKEVVCFMIQEMEAWFLSQPAILDKYYKTELSKKIPKKHAREIQNPDEELQKLVKNNTDKEYHKVKDGAKLLPLLDLVKLESDFKDVKKLVGLLS